MRFRWLALVALLAAPAAADPVYDMCMRPGNLGHEQCDCVSAGVRDAFTAEEHSLYSTVAVKYLQRRNEGMPLSEAWNAAVQSHALELTEPFVPMLMQTRELGERHRQIVERCAG